MSRFCEELRRSRWTIVIVCIAVTLFAVFTTRSLPASSLYEVRYETHIRNYVKNTLPEYLAMDLTDVAPYDSVARYLTAMATPFPGTDILSDELRTILIRVRHADPDSARCIAQYLYGLMVDTVQRAGDSMRVQQAAYYRFCLDSLRTYPSGDSTDALIARLSASLTLLQEPDTNGRVYLDLLNDTDASVPHRLPGRWWVVLGVMLASLLLCLALALLKSFEPRPADESAR